MTLECGDCYFIGLLTSGARCARHGSRTDQRMRDGAFWRAMRRALSETRTAGHDPGDEDRS